MPPEQRLIELRSITKRFGAITALTDVDLTVSAGEVLGVVGHNGAGKSTLMHVLAGIVQPTEGEIILANRPVGKHDPGSARQFGLRCVFQELSLCPNLTVFENLKTLHPSLGGLRWRRRARDLICSVLDEIFPGHSISPDRSVADLSIGERQMTEIARAFTVTDVPVSLVILDEPTSSLDASAAKHLLDYLRTTALRGIGCILVSHKLRQIREHTDRIVGMRDGRVVATAHAKSLSSESLSEMMGVVAGTAAPAPSQTTLASAGSQLRVRGLIGEGIALEARSGEIIGLGGLDGHGQSKILHRIFDRRRTDVAIQVEGSVAFVSGDRQAEGVFRLWSVGRNITIVLIHRIACWGMLARRRETSVADSWCQNLNIRTPSSRAPILSLSGGNQQKALVARALSSDADVILLDDPTRGVDIGTKRELHQKIRMQAAAGRCFVWYTTESEELRNCTRTYIFYESEIVDAIDSADLTDERVLHASFGIARAGSDEESHARHESST